MALTSPSLDDRKRKSRNIVFASLLILFFLWTFKLSYPQYTVVSSYNMTSPLAHSGLKTRPSPHGTPKTKPANPKAPSGIVMASENFQDVVGEKAAVIIETRFRQNIIPLILHFSSVLGPEWPVLIYTSAEAVGLFSASAALNRYLHSGAIQIRILPQTVLFTNSDSVSAFLTKKWLWESLGETEYILIFQSDSMLCANAARSVDDYFMYDFVGAPIRGDLGNGYNGGLSLRRKSSIVRVLDNWDWEKNKKEENKFEDQWFYNRLVELQQEEAAAGIAPEDEGAINLPSMEVARTFSVETIDFPHPLGVHQVHRWLKEQMPRLDEWCPEYKLCSEDRVVV